MLQASTIQFLIDLKENNNKIWFEANKTAYETAKKDFEQFVGQVLDKMTAIIPELANQKPKDCVFRIFRDVRFSKDKSPYKPNFGAVFAKGGRKSMGAGYYIHLEPNGSCFAGGGIWMPENNILKAIRQEIDYNLDEFESIVNNKKFKTMYPAVEGEKLKNPPQGYDANHKAIEYLKLKSFTVHHQVSDNLLLKKDFAENVFEMFETMTPFIHFLDRAVELEK